MECPVSIEISYFPVKFTLYSFGDMRVMVDKLKNMGFELAGICSEGYLEGHIFYEGVVCMGYRGVFGYKKHFQFPDLESDKLKCMVEEGLSLSGRLLRDENSYRKELFVITHPVEGGGGEKYLGKCDRVILGLGELLFGKELESERVSFSEDHVTRILRSRNDRTGRLVVD